MRPWCWVLLLGACQSAPPPRKTVQKQGDVVIKNPQKIQNQDVVVREGNLALQGQTSYRLEESTLKAMREDPFPRITVDEFARLELQRSKIEEFGVRLKGNAGGTFTESTVGRVTVENKGELRASKSEMAEVSVGGESRVVLTDCRVGDLTLRLQGITAEFSELRSGPPTNFTYEKGFSLTLERTQVRRWKFVVGNSTHVTFEKCGDLVIVFEVRDKVATFDDLAPGPISDRVVSTRNAAITVMLRDCGVAEWGMRGAGEAVLGARRSTIGEVTATERSRVILMESATSGRDLVSQDAATLELDRSQAAAGAYHVRDRAVLKMTKARLDDGARFFGWDSGLIECWEMYRPQRIELHDGSKLVAEGHEVELKR
jgi:hypothetical protein